MSDPDRSQLARNEGVVVYRGNPALLWRWRRRKEAVYILGVMGSEVAYVQGGDLIAEEMDRGYSKVEDL